MENSGIKIKGKLLLPLLKRIELRCRVDWMHGRFRRFCENSGKVASVSVVYVITGSASLVNITQCFYHYWDDSDSKWYFTEVFLNRDSYINCCR